MYTNESVVPNGAWEQIDPPRGIVALPTVDNRFDISPLLRPPLPQSRWRFAASTGKAMYLGRAVRHVRAVRRTDLNPVEVVREPATTAGIDEYECAVDDELGILLRLIGKVDDRPVTTVAAEEVRVNVDVPGEMFSFSPPVGARIAHVSWTG